MGFHWLTLTAAMLGVNGMDGGQEGRQGYQRGAVKGDRAQTRAVEKPRF